MDKTIPKPYAHITKMKDVKELKFQPNQDKNSSYQFVCPVTSLEFNGFNQFFFLWTCGCVFSEKALSLNKKPKTSSSQDKNLIKTCPVCSQAFDDKDMVSLNLTEEEQAKKQQKILEKKNKKKEKKIQKQMKQ